MSGLALRRSAVTVNKKYREYFLPTVLTAMATNIAMIVDSIIAGNLVGQTSLAAISLMSPVTQFYFSVTILFGPGASSIISYAKGKRDEKRSNRVAVAVEEMAASCAERMKEKRKKADIDIRIFADKGEIVISVRDNGDELDPTREENEFEISPLTVVKAISNSVEYSRVPGFNRTVIKL